MSRAPALNCGTHRQLAAHLTQLHHRTPVSRTAAWRSRTGNLLTLYQPPGGGEARAHVHLAALGSAVGVSSAEPTESWSSSTTSAIELPMAAKFTAGREPFCSTASPPSVDAGTAASRSAGGGPFPAPMAPSPSLPLSAMLPVSLSSAVHLLGKTTVRERSLTLKWLGCPLLRRSVGHSGQ